MTVYKWVNVSVCVMLCVSDFVKGMQCNMQFAYGHMATDSMNVVLCIGLLYSLLSTRPLNC